METQALNFLPMGFLDKFTKKATTSAVENAKETLNEKLETYSGIIKIGLTLGVIVFGSRKINQHISKQQETYNYRLPNQQPIIINNYYDRRYEPHGKRQTHKKY